MDPTVEEALEALGVPPVRQQPTAGAMRRGAPTPGIADHCRPQPAGTSPHDCTPVRKLGVTKLRQLLYSLRTDEPVSRLLYSVEVSPAFWCGPKSSLDLDTLCALYQRWHPFRAAVEAELSQRRRAQVALSLEERPPALELRAAALPVKPIPVPTLPCDAWTGSGWFENSCFLDATLMFLLGPQPDNRFRDILFGWAPAPPLAATANSAPVRGLIEHMYADFYQPMVQGDAEHTCTPLRRDLARFAEIGVPASAIEKLTSGEMADPFNVVQGLVLDPLFANQYLVDIRDGAALPEGYAVQAAVDAELARRAVRRRTFPERPPFLIVYIERARSTPDLPASQELIVSVVNGTSAPLDLLAVVLYNGAHYTTLFSCDGSWFFYDDKPFGVPVLKRIGDIPAVQAWLNRHSSWRPVMYHYAERLAERLLERPENRVAERAAPEAATVTVEWEAHALRVLDYLSNLDRSRVTDAMLAQRNVDAVPLKTMANWQLEGSPLRFRRLQTLLRRQRVADDNTAAWILAFSYADAVADMRDTLQRLHITSKREYLDLQKSLRVLADALPQVEETDKLALLAARFEDVQERVGRDFGIASPLAFQLFKALLRARDSVPVIL